MTTQPEKNEIIVKIKGLHKRIDSVTTYITGMKYVNKNIDEYNELMDEARNTKPSLMKPCTMRIIKY